MKLIRMIDSFLFSKKSSRIILVTTSLVFFIRFFILPTATAFALSNKFMKLVYECDTAMESSWYYKNSKIIDKSELVQMLSCHEYDKVRKILLMSGLSENYLSWLGFKKSGTLSEKS